MLSWMDSLIQKYSGNVPTVDVMGFKVVAGGELTSKLKFAAFAADQYWRAWDAYFKKKQFDWAKYEDKMDWYFKEWAMKTDIWAKKMEYALEEKKIAASLAGAATSAGASTFSARLRYSAAMAATAAKMAVEGARMKEQAREFNKEMAFKEAQNKKAVNAWNDYINAADSSKTSAYVTPSVPSGGSSSGSGSGWIKAGGKTYNLKSNWGGSGGD